MGLQDIRPKLKAAVDGMIVAPYTLVATRNILGYNRLPDDSELLDKLQAEGPYMVIMPGLKLDDILGEQLQFSQRRYQVPCLLWIGIPKEPNNDFLKIEAFVDGLASTFKAGAGVLATQTTWDAPIINVTASGSTIVCYEIRVTIVGC
jgi:hypothetical protein